MADEQGDSHETSPTAPSPELSPNATIGGVYKIIELISRGGMGEVYLARHETLGKKCALKVIPPGQVNEESWQRFQLEARAVAKLEHINLVKVTDLGIHNQCLPFYAMDYVDGKNLADIIAESGPMSLDAVLDIFMQVCDGVYCAHRNGLIHRDLKPANIIVCRTDNQKRLAKVLDFGLVKLTRHDRSQQSLTAFGDVFGSPNYMSPEQCKGEKLDERSDIYSLGCTMFECLTGSPPFDSTMPAAIFFSHMESTPPTLAAKNGGIAFPAAMEAVMARILRKKPEDRYQSLLELRDDLAKISAKGTQGTKASTRRISENHKQSSTKTANGASGASVGKKHTAMTLSTIAIGALSYGVYSYWRAGSKAPQSTSQPSVQKSADKEHEAFHNETKALEKELPGQDFPQHQIVTASLLLSKPFSTELKENGKSFRQFDFPTDVTIGLITTPTQERPVRAVGRVKYPIEENLVFVPAEIVGRYPNCIKRFRPFEISGVKFPPDADAKTFRAISNLNNVYVLDFSMCKGVTAESITPLTAYRHLFVILGSSNNVEVLTLAKAGCLEELRELYLFSGQNAADLLNEIKNLPKLNKFGIWCSLTPRDFQAIAGLSKLTWLDINKTNASNADLAGMSSLTNLTNLNIRGTNINAGAIETLKHFKKLKVLQINSPKLPAADFEKIKMALPAVTVS